LFVYFRVLVERFLNGLEFVNSMDINYIENKKGSAVFEVRGVTHGFCNLLKDELTKDADVKIVTYRVDHPIVGVPRMKIEAKDVKASIKKAVKALEKQMDDARKEVEALK